MTTAAVESSSPVLKAPFPAFGGKSRVAAEVLRRLDGEFGTPSWDPCRNWVEPFAFTAIVTLRRRMGAIETINDRNAFVSNFWRAVRADPDAVAFHADWPVNETDLHARHRWLVASGRATALLQRVRDDPDFYDVKIAGWWCWGACCWIGSGWCDETHRNSSSETRPDIEGQMVTVGAVAAGKMPFIGDRTAYGRGVVAGGIQRDGSISTDQKRPRAVSSVNGWMPGVIGPRERVPGLAQDGWGINAGGSGQGVNKSIGQLPPMCGSGEDGAEGDDPRTPSKLPPLDAGQKRAKLTGNGIGNGVHAHAELSACDDRRRWITSWMRSLADRIRPVRVCCGHWSRVCDSPSTMTRLGTTGVFLDPPYRISLEGGIKNRTRHIYANDRNQDVNALCDDVQEWCLRWGAEKDVRIALCGLEGEYPAIDALTGKQAWDKFEWKSNGGYGNRKAGSAINENAARERIWFSPGCVKPRAKEAGLWE